MPITQEGHELVASLDYRVKLESSLSYVTRCCFKTERVSGWVVDLFVLVC